MDPFLPVRAEHLFTADNVPTSRYAIFLREEDGREHEVGNVSETYQLIPNQDVYNVAIDILDSSGMEYEHGRTLFDGKRYTQTWSLPELHVEPKVGDVVNLTMSVLNSYDGSRMFGIAFRTHRLVCENGMMVEFLLGNFRFRHYNTPQYAQEIGNAANTILQLHTRLPELDSKLTSLTQQAFSREYAQQMFTKLRLGPTFIGAVFMAISDDTLWGLYNACTETLTKKESHAADSSNYSISKHMLQ